MTEISDILDTYRVTDCNNLIFDDVTWTLLKIVFENIIISELLELTTAVKYIHVIFQNVMS